MTKDRTLAYIVVAVTLLFVASAFVTPFTGFAPEAFPVPQVNPPAQPAGYAFAIWGVIYLWLIASAFYGVFRRLTSPDWSAARIPLVISLGIGMFWLSVAARSPVGATIMIWSMWGTALLSLARAPATDRWWFLAPVGLYTGWLTAASSVSIGLLGGGYGLMFSEEAWAFVVAAIATSLGLGVLTRIRNAPEFAFGIAWALIAVAVKAAGTNPTLSWCATGCAALILITSAFAAWSKAR